MIYKRLILLLVGVLIFCKAMAGELTTSSKVEEVPAGRGTGLQKHGAYDFPSCKKWDNKAPLSKAPQKSLKFKQEFLKQLKLETLAALKKSEQTYSTIRECLQNRHANSVDCFSIQLEHKKVLHKHLEAVRKSTFLVNFNKMIGSKEISQSDFADSNSDVFDRVKMKNLSPMGIKEFSEPTISEKKWLKSEFLRIREKARIETLKREGVSFEFEAALSSEIEDAAFTELGATAADSRKEYEGIVKDYPIFINYSAAGVSLEAAGESYTSIIIEIKRQKENVSKLNENSLSDLIFFTPIVNEMLNSYSGDENRHWQYCSYAQSLLNEMNNRESIFKIGLGAAALLGLAACPFTGGSTCAVVLTSASVAAEAVNIGYMQNRYSEGIQQKKAELIDSKRLEDLKFDRDASVILAPLSVMGRPGKLVPKKASSYSLKESAKPIPEANVIKHDRQILEGSEITQGITRVSDVKVFRQTSLWGTNQGRVEIKLSNGRTHLIKLTSSNKGALLTDKMIADIAESLKRLPENSVKKLTSIEVTRPRGDNLAYVLPFMPSKIYVSNSFNMLNQGHIIPHEFGHTIYFQSGLQLRGAWKSAMKADPNAVSRYGNTSLWEDFAEGTSAYLSPSKVVRESYRERFPHRFKVLDEVFIGKYDTIIPLWPTASRTALLGVVAGKTGQLILVNSKASEEKPSK